MIDRKFEKFRGGPSHRTDLKNKLRATINRRGMIYLNNKLYGELGQPRAVALYYNREDDQIAVQPAFERSDETFLVKAHGSGWAVRASTFCRHYRIRVPSTEEFLRPELSNAAAGSASAAKTLLLDLRQTMTVGGIERKRPNQNCEQ